MSAYKIPVSAIPNQFITTTIDGVTWSITLETRLGNIYISLSTKDGDVISNRVCRDRVSVGGGFVFVDTEGKQDPIYDGLGVRYLLLNITED